MVSTLTLALFRPSTPSASQGHALFLEDAQTSVFTSLLKPTEPEHYLQISPNSSWLSGKDLAGGLFSATLINLIWGVEHVQHSKISPTAGMVSPAPMAYSNSVPVRFQR